MIIKTFLNTYLQNRQSAMVHEVIIYILKMNGAKTLKIHTEVDDNHVKHNDISFINFGSVQSLIHPKNPLIH